MNARKTLTNIVVAGIAGGGVGLVRIKCCSELTDSRYDFEGYLQTDDLQPDEYVEFGRFNSWYEENSNYLIIIKRGEGGINEEAIMYVDKRNDLIVDKVIVDKVGIGNPYTVYRKDAGGEQVLKQAQPQYEDYLKKILEYKQQQAVDSIK